MKYRLKGPRPETEVHDEICINCGKRRPKTIKVIKMPSGKTIRPNTSKGIVKGLLGPLPGTWLGCKFGSHNFYLDYEVEEDI